MGKAMKSYEGQGHGNLKIAGWREELAPFVDDVTEVFVDPADEDPTTSYALTNKVASMGLNDHAKIAIIESDDETITIENIECTGGNITITGDFAVRHSGTVNALLYAGSVKTFEPTEIDLADTSHEPLVIWWLPSREHGKVCGTVVVVENPNPSPTPSPAPSPTPPSPTPAPTPTPSPSPSPSPPPPDDCDTISGNTSPLPTACSPSASNGYRTGLCAEWYKSDSGIDATTCWLGDCIVDGTPDALQWATNGPGYSLGLPSFIQGAAGFAVVWKGEIQAPHSSGCEEYTFYISYDNGPEDDGRG